jgi:hypothetical protein
MRSALGLAAAALMLVIALWPQHDPGPHLSAVHTKGSLSLSNSRPGAAVLTASNLRPGRSVQGTVTIRNTDSRPATLSLGAADLRDAPGPGGGRLSQRLRLTVRELSRPPRTLYAGTFAAMPRRVVGSLGPGAQRTFEFSALLPDGGAPSSPTGGDNAFAGSATSVRYVWRAEAPEPGPAPKPKPKPKPKAPAKKASPPARGPGGCRPRVRVRSAQRVVRRGVLIARLALHRPCHTTVRAFVRGRGGRPVYLRGLRGRRLRADRNHRVVLRLRPAVRRMVRRGTIVRIRVRAVSPEGWVKKAEFRTRVRAR